MVPQPRNSKDCSNYQKLEEAKKDCSLEPSGGTRSCLNLDFRFLDSRTMKEKYSVLSHPVLWYPFYGSPRKLMYVTFHIIPVNSIFSRYVPFLKSFKWKKYFKSVSREFNSSLDIFSNSNPNIPSPSQWQYIKELRQGNKEFLLNSTKVFPSARYILHLSLGK